MVRPIKETPILYGELPYHAGSLTSWRANEKRRQGYPWNHKSIIINIPAFYI